MMLGTYILILDMLTVHLILQYLTLPCEYK